MTQITSTLPLAGVTSSVAAKEPADIHVAAPVQLSVPKSNMPQIDSEKMRQQLQEAISQLNAQMEKSNQNLHFSMDNVLDYPVVTVKNSVTGDVVRQIPNETTIRVAHDFEKLKGLLFNRSA